MTFLESVHDKALEAYARLVMPKDNSAQPVGGRVLLYANIGLGDLVLLLPVIRALDTPSLTICLDDEEKQTFLRMMGVHNAYIYPTEWVDHHDYDTVICNFQQQWTPIVRQIIARRIPCRVGHVWRDKYQWLWTRVLPCRGVHVRTANNTLLWPFHIDPVDERVEVEKDAGCDVLIVPHSKWPEKDWPHFDKLASRLLNLHHHVEVIDCHWPMDKLLRHVSGARIVIGNDSGLPKVKDAMGGNAIQIFRSGAPGPERWGLKQGVDLIEPTVDEVINQIRRWL